MKSSVYNKETNAYAVENYEAEDTDYLKSLFDTYPSSGFSFGRNANALNRSEAGNLLSCVEAAEELPADWVAIWDFVYEDFGIALDRDHFKNGVMGPFDSMEEADGAGEIMSDHAFDVITVSGVYYVFYP